MSEEALKAIGRFRWKRPPSPYESFIEEENIPIIHGLGVYDVRELALGPWKRTGGMGALSRARWFAKQKCPLRCGDSTRGALIPEKHMYEEVCYVVQGRGSTEVWRDDKPEKKQMFEWQKGSLFSPRSTVGTAWSTPPRVRRAWWWAPTRRQSWRCSRAASSFRQSVPVR